jgi:hypothetical protein
MTMNLTKGNRNTLLALLALGLFIMFDIVGVSLNYLLSWRVEQQAIGINLAGRQRMLSQRMVKVLLQIDNARRNGESAKAYYEELKLTFGLFDNTLKGFDAGHETKGGAGEKLFLPAVTEPKARQAVSEAVTLWQDYRSKVAALIERGEQGDESVLKAALTEAQARNLKLLGLMNSLTTELELLTQAEAQRIRVYQAVVLLLALLCFVGAFVLFRRGNAEMLLARQLAADAARAEQNYVTDLVTHTTSRLQMAADLPALAHQLFATLAPAFGIGAASMYRFDATNRLLIACGQYAREGELTLVRQIALDEGLVGECAQSRQLRVISKPPEGFDFGFARTALMQARPDTIVLQPVVNNDTLFGLIEMVLLQPLEPRHEEVLKALLPMVAMRLDMLGRTTQQTEKETEHG